MVPQYVRQVAPQYTLPGGQTAVANVGVGAAVSQLGAGIKQAAERKLAREDALAVNRAWRDIEQWQLDYLSGVSGRREELSRTQVDPETGSTVTGYQVEIEGFGKKLDERFAQASANLSTRAKEELEKRFNTHAPTYGRYTADTLSQLELEDITAEIQSLATTDHIADAKELSELYSDRYSPGDRQRIEATIDEAAVEARLGSAGAYLQNAAQAEGWEAAVNLIDDPEWQQAMGLDIADSARVHNELSTFARTQEGKERRAAAIEADTLRNHLFADAMADQLDDPTQIDAALRSGVVSPAEAKQLQELVKKGPPEQSDLTAISEVREAILDYQTGAKTQTEAQEVIRSNTGKLSAEDAKAMTNRLYGEVESELVYWQREANKNIEDSIYPRDYFGQQERKEPYVTIASEVKLRLDKAVEDARKAGQPLSGRDIVIKARDLVSQARVDIHKYEERIEAEGFGAGIRTRKVLDIATAVEYLRRAGGDREKAKKMAAEDGYEE